MSKFKVGDFVQQIDYPENKDYIESFHLLNNGQIRYVFKGKGGQMCMEQYLELVPETTPKKFDNDKPRLDLIRPEFTMGMGEALAYGAKKYSEPVGETPNYLKGDGFNYSRIIGSLERHIQQFKMGIDKDDESGLSHLKHAAVNLMFLLAYEESEHGIDDRVILEK